MTPDTVKDPVCGMDLGPAAEAEELGAETVDHAGKTFYFCCPMCAQTFQKRPAEYVARAGGAPGLTGDHSH